MTPPADDKPAKTKKPRDATPKAGKATPAAKVAGTTKPAAAKAVTKPAVVKKATTPKPTPAKPAKPKAAPVPELLAEPAADTTAVAVTRLKELVARVATATDSKRAQVRTVVEALLVEMGAALEKGETLHLPGLGRMRVARTRAQGSGSVMSVKLKRAGAKAPQNSAAAPLADDGEDS